MATASLKELAIAHNTRGNDAFKAGNYQEASQHYSSAIAADGSVAKYWTNRANALWRQLGQVESVLADAEHAIQRDPKWLKGYYFKGVALERLGRFTEAVQALKTAMQLEPSSSVALALQRCQEFMRLQQAFRAGRPDPVTIEFRRRTAATHSIIKQHCYDASVPPDSRFTLFYAYENVVAGDALCAADPPDFEAAAEQYRKAAGLNCAAGMWQLAQLLRLGLALYRQQDGTDRDVAAAARALLSAAMQQHPFLDVNIPGPRLPNVGVNEAWIVYGDMLRDGVYEFRPSDRASALTCYQKGAQRGDCIAQAAIGYLHELNQDYAAALSWYRKAAEQHWCLAEYHIAVLLQDPDTTLPQDCKEETLRLAKLAAEHGLVKAKVLQAQLAPDSPQAAALLIEAAEDGEPASVLALAMAYFDGAHGLPQDIPLAQKLLEKAAYTGGDTKAIFVLACSYGGGMRGYEHNPFKALPLIEHAACLGCQPAMVKLAAAYMSGMGCKPSLAKAKHWAQNAVAPSIVADPADRAEAAGILQQIEEYKELGEEGWAELVNAVHKMMSQCDAAGYAGLMEHLAGVPADAIDSAHKLFRAFQSTKPGETAMAPTAAAAATATTAAAAGKGGTGTSIGLGKSAAAANRSADYCSSGSGTGGSSTSSSTFRLDDLDQFRLSGFLEKQQKANNLREMGLAALAEREDWDTAVVILAAGYALCPAAMGTPPPHQHGVLLENALQWSKRHPNRAEGLLLHVFLHGYSRGRRWIVQQLQKIIPRLSTPVMQGLVLLTRSEMQFFADVDDYQGALDDAEKGLKLLPGHPDLLFLRAWALNATKYSSLESPPVPPLGTSKSSKASSRARYESLLERRRAAAAEVAAAYQQYLDAAPEGDRHRPAALYYMAFIPLNEDMVQNDAGTPAADVINRAQAFYDAAREAEEKLPKQFLPVNCAVRDRIPMMLALRRVTASDVDSSSGSVASSSGGGVGGVSRSNGASAVAGASSSGHEGGCSSSKGSLAGSGATGSKSRSKGQSRGGSSGGSSSNACCAACGVTGVKLRKCSGCAETAYCGRECQVAHWKEHKKVCASRH